MCEKTYYSTKKRAKKAAKLFKRLAEYKHKLYAYKCPDCSGFHLTKTKQELTLAKQPRKFRKEGL